MVFSEKSLEHPEKAFSEAARLYDIGAFHLHIEHTFSIEQIATAQEISAARRVTGKLIITIS